MPHPDGALPPRCLPGSAVERGRGEDHRLLRQGRRETEGGASVDSHHFAQRFPGRQFAWSFVGTVKQDRQLMLDTMASVGPHAIATNGTSPTRMHDIYARSIYVPAGRVTRLPALPPPMGRV